MNLSRLLAALLGASAMLVVWSATPASTVEAAKANGGNARSGKAEAKGGKGGKGEGGNSTAKAGKGGNGRGGKGGNGGGITVGNVSAGGVVSTGNGGAGGAGAAGTGGAGGNATSGRPESVLAMFEKSMAAGKVLALGGIRNEPAGFAPRSRQLGR